MFWRNKIVHSPQTIVHRKKPPSPRGFSVDYGLWSMDSLGFTLIEVLIAVAILATGLVLVVEAMGRTQQAIRVSENLATASLLAEEQMAASEIDVRQEHQLRPGTESGNEILPGRKFKWSKKIEPYRDPSIEDETKLNEVSVKVEWKEGGREAGLETASVLLNREKQR